ncbi:MAG: hypothetical protein GXY54_00955 [Deltaproteobacteria bacterium]|nr:hypothetical protein [Deltaproteobacteria bacterium]
MGNGCHYARRAPTWLAFMDLAGGHLTNVPEWAGEAVEPWGNALHILVCGAVVIWQWRENDFLTAFLGGMVLGTLIFLLLIPVMLALVFGLGLLGCVVSLCSALLAWVGGWELPESPPPPRQEDVDLLHLRAEIDGFPAASRSGRGREERFLLGVVLGAMLGFWLDE